MKVINIQNKWIVYYFTYKDSLEDINNLMRKVGNKESIEDIYDEINCGFTYSNLSKRTSVVFVSKADSKAEFLNTFVHELKHVQSHICEYYDVSESSEEAAYLIGYLTKLLL